MQSENGLPKLSIKKKKKVKNPKGYRTTTRKISTLIPDSTHSEYVKSEGLLQANHLFMLAKAFPKLSKHFGRELMNVRDKIMLRFSPEMKRYICKNKRCGSILDITQAKIGKNGECILKCDYCQTIRRIKINNRKSKMENINKSKEDNNKINNEENKFS